MLSEVLEAMQTGKLFARVAYIAGQEASRELEPRIKPNQTEVEDIVFAFQLEHTGELNVGVATAIFILGATCQQHMNTFLSTYSETRRA